MTEVQRRASRKTGPSILDVARFAGVSAQTVSRVSTGSAAVRPETRDRVLVAMEKLGYAPNRAARALRNGSFRTIGVITQRLERTGETLTAAAVMEALEAADYTANLIQAHNPSSGDLRRAAKRLIDQSVDGLIVIRAGLATLDTLGLPQDIPVVVSDSLLVTSYPSVIPDQVSGTRDAVNHLLELGHKTVHHISGSSDSHPSIARSAAWRRTLEEAGVQAPDQWEGDWTPQSGYLIGREVAENPEVTAVFCANDEMAFGLMRALHEQGKRVPEDVSVVGFDNIALSEFSAPPLTTVSQDFAEIGRRLVELVLDWLDPDPNRTRTQIVIPTKLLVRGTTAPPRAD
ncbi:LacI family DNA-binding transcriptional regulator [Timonella senegalensis]|uniref:LacI family DNA-binding transcriptional regulator n=2 Tax=Timonella senegalensis TaxID=1465825 RepID=UPI002FDE844F